MADTATSALPSATLPLAGTEVFYIVQSGVSKKIGALDMGVSQIKGLTADASAFTSTTVAKLSALDLTAGIGAYKFEYRIVYRSAATSTGIKIDVNHSGTVDPFVWTARYVDATASAPTGIVNQNFTTATGSEFAGYSRRVKGTSGAFTMVGVDTASADLLLVIEGAFYCSAAGNLELYVGTEVASSGITVRRGTSAELIRAA